MKYAQLETPRLILREFRESDLSDFYEYCKNPNIGPSAGWPPHKNKEESVFILRRFIQNGDVWAIVDKETKKVIGSFGLHEEKKRADTNTKMIGYVLHEDYWGKGLMSEAVAAVLRYAFETLCLEMVSVYHYPHNNRSRRVIEKNGFVFEGTLRRGTVLYDGTVLDDMCYSLTRAEYFNKQKEQAKE